MTILVALVASGSNVLASALEKEEHANFLTAAETIIARIPPNSSKLSYVYEDVLFHYNRQDDVTYLAVADSEAGRRLPFAFLSEVSKSFLASYDAEAIADARTDYSPFSKQLSGLLRHFNDNPDSDPVQAAKTELAGVKEIMTQNVEMILNRGERLELLMDRTDQAAHQSVAFRRRAVGLRRQMWWKNAKVLAMAVFCGVVLLVLIWSMLH